MDGYDEYGLRVETEFIGNALGVDPSGCRCTDCLVGNSIPFDNTAKLSNLARDVAAGDRKAINRTNYSLVVVEDMYGEVRF
jgi:hypothetical protein